MRPAERESQAEPDWLTVSPTAALCGTTPGTLRYWVAVNKYGWRDRRYKIGGSVRFKRQDVLDWIEERRGDPNAVARRRGALSTVLAERHA